ncbi:MAG TPA: Flp family type IVb pilin [Syntrophomonadaceae bacterium]|nr:Flp family type IVb pilin [Syntrophomonadaceae bacterium]
MMNMFKRLVKEEEGQGMVEYALIISLVAVLLIAGLTGLKDGIAGAFNSIVNAL